MDSQETAFRTDEAEAFAKAIALTNQRLDVQRQSMRTLLDSLKMQHQMINELYDRLERIEGFGS